MKNNTALLLRRAFLWFLGRPSIFSYTCGLFGFRLLRIVIVQCLARPCWVSPLLPLPHPDPQDSGAPRVLECRHFISSKALLPTGLVSQEGRVFALRLQQPTRGGGGGFVGIQFPDFGVPPCQVPSPALSMTLHHRDLRN